MAVLTHVPVALIEDFLDRYGLPKVNAVRGIAAGSVNTNYAVSTGKTTSFLRVYEEQDRAGAVQESELLTVLADAGIPVAGPMQPKGRGGPIGEILGKPAALFPWRDGDIRCQKGVTAGDTARVGGALARVHVAARPLAATRTLGRFTCEKLELRLPVIRDSGAPGARDLAEWLERVLPATDRERAKGLPSGVIHSDLFRDNVLWNGEGEVAALLDFESACVGPWMYDLAVTILSWCFGDAFDPALARALASGYEAVRAVTEPERAGIWNEARFAALRFLTTRVTDYALRAGDGPRVMKDWRRFQMRFEFLERVGAEGLRAMLWG